MLIEDLYKVDSFRNGDDAMVYEVSLNPECKVYQGHFPGEPITPGVCSIQMIKELAESAMGRRFRFSNVKQCRYTNLITPSSVPHAVVTLKLTEDDGSRSVNIAASIDADGKNYLSLKGELADA